MTIDIDALVRCLPGDANGADHIALTGPARVAASAFDVDGLLAESAAFSISAVDGLAAVRGMEQRDRRIDLAHLLAFCTTHVDVDGETVPAWSDLSGVYPTRSGRHLQVHCNFPHHSEGVVRRLGCGSDRESVAAAIAERDPFELEAELIADGMIGAAVRTLDEWDVHPHAESTRDLSIVAVEQIGEADPIIDDPPDAASAIDEAGLAGLRVLDCSRVLAGPVAGHQLASFGADVMRLGADHLPSVPVGVISTGFGKRNASLDLRTPSGVEAMEGLLRGAHVWIDAYRPGALAGHGATPERAARLRPGVVVVQISAFDWTGPWAGRRGFDSVVQSTTGVRWAGGESAVDGQGSALGSGPTGLPVQALDYATGFLAAGAAAHLVAHQRRVGGSWLARLSLLRTRNRLVGRGGPRAYQPASVDVDPRLLHRVDSEFGRVTTVRPPAGRIGSPPRPLGSSPPRWST